MFEKDSEFASLKWNNRKKGAQISILLVIEETQFL